MQIQTDCNGKYLQIIVNIIFWEICHLEGQNPISWPLLLSNAQQGDKQLLVSGS